MTPPVATGRFGERLATIHPYRPDPQFYDGTLYYVVVDDERLSGPVYVDVDEAKQAAESKVGHTLSWES